MDVLVVGAGTMGRWFAGAVGDVASVAVADVDSAAAETAADATGATAVPLDGERRFDAVCFAVPIPAVGEAIVEHAHRAERALLDVTGVMAEPVEAMAAAAPDRERVSLHPLFAPGNAPGNVAVVPDAAGPATDVLRTALTERGNHLFETTAAEHDEAMESVQAAAHAAVLAYGIAADGVRDEFHTPLSAGLADLVDQVTAGEARVYADIQAAFDGADGVAEAAGRVADADSETFRHLYEAAREGRETTPAGEGEPAARERDGAGRSEG